MDLSIDGQPTRHIAAGDHFQVPAGGAHSIKFGNQFVPRGASL